MPRRLRLDFPGAFHHVFNRGAARRTVAETADDAQAFFDGLQRVVEDGLLEVHVFSLLTTHYHLGVASPVGDLGEAMRRLGNSYVRTFNRRRRRDGALMRGRYGSRLVTTSTYFETLVRYIDANPVGAGLVAAPHLYRYGSAGQYASVERPGWLTTARVEALVTDRMSAVAYDPSLYPAFCTALRSTESGLVEARMRSRGPEPEDPLDDLVRAAPVEVQRWMQDKARLADGTAPGIVVLAPDSIASVLDEREVPDPPRRSVEAGMLRLLCGSTYAAIAARLRCSASVVHVAVRGHVAAMRTDPAYAALAGEIAHAVVRADFGPPRRMFELPRRLPPQDVRVEEPARGFVGADR